MEHGFEMGTLEFGNSGCYLPRLNLVRSKLCLVFAYCRCPIPEEPENIALFPFYAVLFYVLVSVTKDWMD